MNFDYIVVGGGVCGSIISSKLVSKGAVCLVERGDSVGDYEEVDFVSEHLLKFNTTIVPKVLGGCTASLGTKRGDGWQSINKVSVKEWEKWDAEELCSLLQTEMSSRSILIKTVETNQDCFSKLFLHNLKEYLGCAEIAENNAEEPSYSFQRKLGGAPKSVYDMFVGPDVVTLCNKKAIAILCNNGVAKGLLVRDNKGEVSTLLAKKEIILSCGAVNTPKLLALSGLLEPSVTNSISSSIQDKLTLLFRFKTDSQESFAFNCYCCSSSKYQHPNFLIQAGQSKGIFTLSAVLLNSTSHGELIMSQEKMRVKPNFFKSEEDTEQFKEIVSRLEEVVQKIDSPEVEQFLTKINGLSFTPSQSEGTPIYYYDQPLFAGWFHLLGSCKNLIDNNFLLKGYKNLRIVDSSIIPGSYRGEPLSLLMAVSLLAAKMISEHNHINP